MERHFRSLGKVLGSSRASGALAILLMAALASGLQGCAGTAARSARINTLSGNSPLKTACTATHLFDSQGNLDVRNVGKLIEKGDEGIGLKPGELDRVVDLYLDCTVAPITTRLQDGHLAFINQDERETLLSLYRGYVVLAMLTRYAAFNYTGNVGNAYDVDFQSYAGLANDAASVLARIREADFALRSAAATMPGQADLLVESKQDAFRREAYGEKVPTVMRLNRMLNVLMVAIAAEQPAIKRTRNLIGQLAAAANGNPFSVDAIVSDGLNIIQKELVLKTYSSAYVRDAAADLKKASKDATFPQCTDWQKWSVLIEDSCGRIAHVASISQPQCVAAFNLKANGNTCKDTNGVTP